MLLNFSYFSYLNKDVVSISFTTVHAALTKNKIKSIVYFEPVFQRENGLSMVFEEFFRQKLGLTPQCKSVRDKQQHNTIVQILNKYVLAKDLTQFMFCGFWLRTNKRASYASLSQTCTCGNTVLSS